MNLITRRSLLVSSAALTAGAFTIPAKAATGQVALHIASAGFIFGVTGGSGTLTFRGQQFPLSIGGIKAVRSRWLLRECVSHTGLSDDMSPGSRGQLTKTMRTPASSSRRASSSDWPHLDRP